MSPNPKALLFLFKPSKESLNSNHFFFFLFLGTRKISIYILRQVSPLEDLPSPPVLVRTVKRFDLHNFFSPMAIVNQNEEHGSPHATKKNTIQKLHYKGQGDMYVRVSLQSIAMTNRYINSTGTESDNRPADWCFV